MSPVLVPRPSLSLHPSQRVPLGDNVTLRCHLPQPAAWVELYQEGKWRSSKEMDQEQDVAEFSLAGINKEDSGTYQCQYQGLAPAGTSEKSDPVKLLVTGEGTGESRWPWADSTGLCSISVTSALRSQVSRTWHFPEPQRTCGDRDRCHHPVLEPGIWGRLPPAQGRALSPYPAPGTRLLGHCHLHPLWGKHS